MLNIVDGMILYRYHGETVRIEAWNEGGIRVRAWMDTEPQDFSALVTKTESSSHTWMEDGSAFLASGGLTCRVTVGGVIGFYDADARLLLEEISCFPPPQSKWATRAQRSPLELRGREWHGKPGTWGVTQRFTAPENEMLFGMGQYQQDIWNLKGTILEMMQRNSQCTVPFLVSSAGYGFLWNTPAIGQAMLGTNQTVWEAPCCDLLDYWITVGDTPADILRQYADATGHAPQMPDYALGFWQSKLRYRTQEEVIAVAEEYHRRGIPLAVIVIDYFHWTCLGEWEYDRRCFPDSAAMAKRLHELGIRLAVSIWPQVAWRSKLHHEMYERGLLARTDRGNDLMMGYGGDSTHIDMTNPEARTYLWQKVQENYETMGVDLYWLDEAEPEFSFYHQELYRYHQGSALRVGNLYPRCYAQGFYEGLTAQGKTPVSLIRCAFAGSQRYASLVWSGDIPSTFQSLRIQVTAGLHMGLAGIPWWTTDIGGFRGGDITDEGFRELLMRWFAFGAFSPVMRLHGDRSPEPPSPYLEDYLRTGADNEIWSFGEQAYTVCRKFIFIREALRPYLQSAFKEASHTGRPVMAALLLSFPNDPAAWSVHDAYMLGDVLLVAPVLERGAAGRQVYLPAGEWTELHTGRKLSGGQTIWADAPLDTIPVYARSDREADFAQIARLMQEK